MVIVTYVLFESSGDKHYHKKSLCNSPHLEGDQILFEEALAFDEPLSVLVYLKKSFSED
jgi:hypothetical protein